MYVSIREKGGSKLYYSATVNGSPRFVKTKTSAAEFDQALAETVLRQLTDLTGKELQIIDKWRDA